jgi:hypothetical protein
MRTKNENSRRLGTGRNSASKGVEGNRFGVKERSNPGRMKVFTRLDDAIVFAVMNYRKEITWINNNSVFSVAGIMLWAESKC